MNRNISINVAKKLASVIDAPVIICGNSDYSITFTFDQEWETLDLKTARFVYKRDGALKFVDVVFSGRTTAVPVLSNIDEVYVGVYSGELHTTTPARIICKKSILCGDSTQHEAPDPDVYQQILEAFNNMETLPTVGEEDAGRALMVNDDGRWVVRLPDFMHDQNSGNLIRFFFGTSEEWKAWTGDKTGVLFCPTDDTTLEDIDATVESVEETVDEIKTGKIAVPYAKAVKGQKVQAQLYIEAGAGSMQPDFLEADAIYLAIFATTVGSVASGVFYYNGTQNAENWSLGGKWVRYYPASKALYIYDNDADSGNPQPIAYDGYLMFYKIGEV